MRGGTDDNNFVWNRRAGTVGGRDGKVKEMLRGGGRCVCLCVQSYFGLIIQGSCVFFPCVFVFGLQGTELSGRRKHALALMTESVRTVLAVGRRRVEVRSTSQTTTSDRQTAQSG